MQNICCKPNIFERKISGTPRPLARAACVHLAPGNNCCVSSILETTNVIFLLISKAAMQFIISRKEDFRRCLSSRLPFLPLPEPCPVWSTKLWVLLNFEQRHSNSTTFDLCFYQAFRLPAISTITRNLIVFSNRCGYFRAKVYPFSPWTGVRPSKLYLLKH